MSLRDKKGTAWAHADTIKEGDRVRTDGGFTCIPANAVRVVKRHPALVGFKGLYIDCVCEKGKAQKHFLDGQGDDDGGLTGLYPA